MATDPRIIAARLGVDELTIRRLQARGHLLHLDVSEEQVRARLLAANVRALHPRDVPPEDPRPAA
jgi:hypothetical protein